MSEEAGFSFDGPSTRRIAAAVQKIGRQVDSRAGQRSRAGPHAAETVFARLTEATDDGFRWEEVVRLEDGTWDTRPNGRTSGDDDEWLAFDLVDGTSSVGDQTVILKRCPVKGEDGTWTVVWIAFPVVPAPTAKYQVYTPIDDTLVPIWTLPRFS